MPERLANELSEQFKDNPNWSWKLHADNLAALARRLDLEAPSYPTVRRYMQSKGWYKCRRILNKTQGQLDAQTRLESREVRGYEVEYVHALWHLDFHHGSLRIPDKNGGWRNAECMCIMDDRSRLICHIQWYYNETAENLIHALCQAFQKRGLPRKLMTDNGAAMIAAETVNGLLDLSIVHETTLPYSPYQNGKQESLWGQLEGRLLAMMQNDPEITLTKLNYNTTLWVAQEYHHNRNRELKATPLEILTTVESVDRPCYPEETLRFAFTHKVCRTQRRSDGTLSLENVRFEVPSHLRHINRLWVRYRRWDLSSAAIVDERDKTVILANIYPQDKTKNANGQRRLLESEPFKPLRAQTTTSPLLEEILEKWKRAGLPAAYTPATEELNNARELIALTKLLKSAKFADFKQLAEIFDVYAREWGSTPQVTQAGRSQSSAFESSCQEETLSLPKERIKTRGEPGQGFDIGFRNFVAELQEQVERARAYLLNNAAEAALLELMRDRPISETLARNLLQQIGLEIGSGGSSSGSMRAVVYAGTQRRSGGFEVGHGGYRDSLVKNPSQLFKAICVAAQHDDRLAALLEQLGIDWKVFFKPTGN